MFDWRVDRQPNGAVEHELTKVVDRVGETQRNESCEGVARQLGTVSTAPGNVKLTQNI